MTRAKLPYKGFGGVDVAVAQTALPTPPVFVADVATNWNRDKSAVSAFDIEIYSAAAVNLTLAELFGVVQVQAAIASDDIDTVDFANDELDIATHGLLNGYGPIQITTTGVMPTGLDLLTDYYVIYTNAGTIQLAASLEDALEGTVVAFTDAGSGTHSILGSVTGDFLTGSNNSYAPRWMSYGLLGPAADGAIALTAVDGYTTRVEHRPRTVCYAVEATLSSAVATTIVVYPVQEAY